MKTVAVIVTLSLAIAGCSPTMGSRETSGTMNGAAVGGLIGSQIGGDASARIFAGIAGAAIGGLIGNRLGAYLDAEERQRLAEITRLTMTTGSTRSFTARSSNARVRTRVVETRTTGGSTCRTVEQRIVLASGATEIDRVDGCRQANGQWAI